MTETKLLVKREGDFHYPICFEENFSNLAQAIREEGLMDRKICIVTDSNVGPLYESAVEEALRKVSSDISVFTFEAGEKNKNLDTVSSLYQGPKKSSCCIRRWCCGRPHWFWGSYLSSRN